MYLLFFQLTNKIFQGNGNQSHSLIRQSQQIPTFLLASIMVNKKYYLIIQCFDEYKDKKYWQIVYNKKHVKSIASIISALLNHYQSFFSNIVKLFLLIYLLDLSQFLIMIMQNTLNSSKNEQPPRVTEEHSHRRTYNEMMRTCIQQNAQNQDDLQHRVKRRRQQVQHQQSIGMQQKHEQLQIPKTEISKMIERINELEARCRTQKELEKQNRDLREEANQLKAMLEERETLMDFLQDQINEKLVSSPRFMESAANYIARIVNPLLVYKQNRELKVKNEELLKEIQSLKDRFAPSSQDSNGNENKAAEVKTQQLREDESGSRQKEVQNKMEKVSAFSKKRAFVIQSAERSGVRFQFTWDTAQSYDTVWLQVVDSLKVRRIVKSENEIASMHQSLRSVYLKGYGGFIISKNSFPKTGKHRVTFRVIQNHKKHPITIGIITNKVKKSGILVGDQKEMISYYTHSTRKGAFVLEQKDIMPFHDNDLGTAQGGCIEMLVDLDNWMIQFTRMAIPNLKIEAKITTGKIGESFKDKRLHVFTCLRNPGDLIDVIQS